MKFIRNHWKTWMLVIALIVAAGCAQQPPAEDGQALGSQFDPENPREYGMMGIYLGQNIAEAIELLKPDRYEFMDAVSRESLTVEQLAQGEGTVAMGMIMVDQAQLMLKVRNAAVESIIMGGVPEAVAPQYKTNRGLALYDSAARLKELYGEAGDGEELVYKGNQYQALFRVHDGKVIGFRFDRVQ